MTRQHPAPRRVLRGPPHALVALAALTAALLLVFSGASALQARAQAASSLDALPYRNVPLTLSATPPAGRVIHVPADYPTIQAGVDAARPGDLVFVAPGSYHEAVVVRVAGITIRGGDRNATVLDGQSQLGNAFLVMADNVVIENLTAHHYLA